MNIKDILFKYLWGINLLLIFGLCYFSAGTLNAYLMSKYLLGSAPPTSASPRRSGSVGASYRPDRSAILGRNIFAMELAGDEFNQLLAKIGSAELPSLRAKLLGVIYFFAGSSLNRATLKLLQQNRSEVFKVGDVITSEIVLSEIEEKLVKVRYPSGKEEEISLEMDKKKLAGVPEEHSYRPPHANLPPEEKERRLSEYRKALGVDNRIRRKSDTEFIIEQEAITEALENLNTLLQDARLVPNMVGEGPDKVTDGFRIFRIRPNSIFNKLGLRNGDVIKAINGVEMNNIERGFELLQQLRYEKHFTLDIDRHEQTMTLSYEVE